MHGLKLDFYLDVRNDSRRLMWTLAHSHGTLFSIINIVFALTLSVLGEKYSHGLQFVSWMLLGAISLMPIGFFAGGLWLTGAEPGVGVFLVPVGALMLLLAVFGMVTALIRGSKQTAAEAPPKKPSKSRKRNARRGHA
jgi:hypothetical protein